MNINLLRAIINQMNDNLRTDETNDIVAEQQEDIVAEDSNYQRKVNIIKARIALGESNNENTLDVLDKCIEFLNVPDEKR